METLKSLCNKYWISIVGAAIVLLIIAIFSIQSGCETKQFNQTIGNQAQDANKAVREAVNANLAAVNASIERRTEDAIREKTITPELERRRRNSENSKAALEAARKTYNDKKNNPSNLSRSDSDNCFQLKQLFPGTDFEDCR